MELELFLHYPPNLWSVSLPPSTVEEWNWPAEVAGAGEEEAFRYAFQAFHSGETCLNVSLPLSQPVPSSTSPCPTRPAGKGRNVGETCLNASLSLPQPVPSGTCAEKGKKVVVGILTCQPRKGRKDHGGVFKCLPFTSGMSVFSEAEPNWTPHKTSFYSGSAYQ